MIGFIPHCWCVVSPFTDGSMCIHRCMQNNIYMNGIILKQMEDGSVEPIPILVILLEMSIFYLLQDECVYIHRCIYIDVQVYLEMLPHRPPSQLFYDDLVIYIRYIRYIRITQLHQLQISKSFIIKFIPKQMEK